MSERQYHSLEVCVHQLNRPKVRVPWDYRMDGWGDCSICTPDEYNRNCEGYQPTTIYYFTVNQKDGAK